MPPPDLSTASVLFIASTLTIVNGQNFNTALKARRSWSFGGEQTLAIPRRRQASQRVVRPDFVVALDPFGGDLADLVERVEQVCAEHLFRSANPRKLISIRLPVDVIERWKATGPGWQTRIAERLSKVR